MKLLKSKYHEKGYWENTTQFEQQTHGKHYPLEHLDVNKVWASVPKAERHQGKDFYKPILEDIRKNGMMNPILVVRATKDELKGQKAKWGKNLCELPFWFGDEKEGMIDVVWGGSNRLYIARELGYTHIEAAMIPTFAEARLLQKCHRHTHPQYYPEKYWL